MFKDYGYYILWAIIAVFPLMIAIISPETIWGKIIASILALAVTYGLTWGLYSEQMNAIDRWNNGVHAECGGAYQFSGATRSKATSSYYYTCDKCGHTEEFPSIMK